ncbi:hypothetical protein DXB06_00005, partial [Butyricicoccus sp. OF13-6]
WFESTTFHQKNRYSFEYRFFFGVRWNGFESRLLETCQWHVSTGVALPQQSESTTEQVGTRVAVRPWAAIANPGRHAPNPKAKQALRFHHLTKPERPFIILI